jgi:PAS domain S-box-containing protein
MRLKTKITLVIVLLVLAVAGATSWLYLRMVTQQVISEANERVKLVTQRIFFQAQNALRDAAGNGETPVSRQPDEVRKYVRNALKENGALSSVIADEASYSLLVYEASIVELDGTVLLSSDADLVGKEEPSRPPLSQLVNAGFVRQLRVLYGPPQAYEVAYPFKLDVPGEAVPFGEIRVAAQSGLLATEIAPALRSAAWLMLGVVGASIVLAILVSNASLAPLGRISAQLDRISQGEFDQAPLARHDEFGLVSTKISAIGQQLRGVREIFSTLRENLDQVLGGLEDGLLLFTSDGHAVMVSPAAQNFLGVPAGQLLGRRASDIFPPEHRLRPALGLQGDDEFAPVAAAEVELPSEAPGLPSRRVGVNVQVIAEGGTRMGALVTLRDLDSIERISRQLEVSERLAALGRVTAGVAHEVKNPLNSMRLWLENLKENLPPGEELPRRAVAVLDSEIDRLDSVVKRFLDFMRTPELRLEETNIEDLLRESAEVARPQMQRSGVQLDTSFAELPPLRLDRALIKQALLNLIFNAIEAMPNGGRLTIGLERHADRVEIRVADTGKGIAPEHRARIFQLFFTTRPGGSGIGLASAYRAVQLHDGDIDFESEVGHGATFRIELPWALALEPALARSRSGAGAMTGSSL